MPSSKKPGVRLAIYDRLISRFFEVFILATFMKRVHGPHIVAQNDPFTTTGARRRFLKNLAFLCDYSKGGPSTTAICVEDRHDSYVAWVASNDGVPSRVVSFLESIIDSLRTATIAEERSRLEEHMVQASTKFAHDRVLKEWKMLVSSARQALDELDKAGYQDRDMESQLNPSAAGTDLKSWLKQFGPHQGQTPTSMCQFAYDIRNSEQMRTIELLLGSAEESPIADSLTYLKRVTHRIGRLAARVRAIKHLIDDAVRLEHHIANPWTVNVVPVPEAASALESDRNTTLRGILKRMMDAGNPEYHRLLSCLEVLDRACSLTDYILSKHADGSSPLKSAVHCEVQLVDYFHDHGLAFWEEDPYIACSKPACLLCRLYMKHHPILFVDIDSHNKIPNKWGPALLQSGNNDPRFTEYRRVLTAMIGDIQGPVLQQIGTMTRSTTFHPDSLDQITQLGVDSLNNLEMDSAFSTDAEDYDSSEVQNSAHATDDNPSDSESEGGASL